ncbi:MAG: hypothetical protein ABW217_04310 [Polyangiaceae bacterium]
MTVGMKINRLLGISETSEAKSSNSNQLSLEALALVSGGDAPPATSPYYPLYQEGVNNMRAGENQFLTGMGGMFAAPSAGPGAVPVLLISARIAWTGEDQFQQGAQQVAQAEAAHAASQQPAPPPPPAAPADSGGGNMSEGVNMSVQPNMSMSDGGYGASGTPVVQVQNEAGQFDYFGYGAPCGG